MHDSTGNSLNDHDLIGYLIGALNSAEHSAVAAQLQEQPEAAVRLDQLRQALRPLQAISELAHHPRTGLTERTLQRLQSQLGDSNGHAGRVQSSAGPSQLISRTLAAPANPSAEGANLAEVAPVLTPPREQPETRFMGGRLRPDIIVACGIAFLAVGLILSAIGKARAQSQIMACQANLHTLYVGLVGYADTHEGRYPLVSPNSTAASFATTLEEAGQVPAGFQPGCPATAAKDVVHAVHYTYSLGFQNDSGQLVGLQRPADSSTEHDLLPISADYPTELATPIAGPLCAHPPVMNVLYVGGQVRITTSPLIGPNGDDIFRNVNGQVAAGVNRMDVVLGRPEDKP